MAALKNVKKKVSQDELRRLMTKHKDKLGGTSKKIDSPLAKYNSDGTLMCVLCNTVVKSEAVWNVHINAKLHRDNIHLAKQRKVSAPPPAQPPISMTALKRLHEPVLQEPVPPKKIRGILKNAPPKPLPSALPKDFFDLKGNGTNKEALVKAESATVQQDSGGIEESEVIEEDNDEDTDPAMLEMRTETIPEGFFDDPIMDAKARNVEYKDPAEEEWEKFQKEIKEEVTVSTQIIQEDQEESTAERQIEEIDEQLRNWNRVLELERKKEAAVKAKDRNRMDVDEENSSEEDTDFDEFLDWRAKKSYQ